MSEGRFEFDKFSLFDEIVSIGPVTVRRRLKSMIRRRFDLSLAGAFLVGESIKDESEDAGEKSRPTMELLRRGVRVKYELCLNVVIPDKTKNTLEK